MRMKSLTLAAGAAAFAVTSTPLPAQRSRPAAAPDWWYATSTAQPPQRSLIFVDRSTVRRTAGEASARTLQAFEQPRGDVRAFAITYDFRCGARHYRARDALFYTTANTQAPENGVVDDWSPVVAGSVAAQILDAACNGRFDGAARRIAGAPMAEAARMFSERAALAQAAPEPRPGPSGLMSRDELLLCLDGLARDTPACRDARASTARGRAARTGNAQRVRAAVR